MLKAVLGYDRGVWPLNSWVHSDVHPEHKIHCSTTVTNTSIIQHLNPEANVVAVDVLVDQKQSKGLKVRAQDGRLALLKNYRWVFVCSKPNRRVRATGSRGLAPSYPYSLFKL